MKNMHWVWVGVFCGATAVIVLLSPEGHMRRRIRVRRQEAVVQRAATPVPMPPRATPTPTPTPAPATPVPVAPASSPTPPVSDETGMAPSVPPPPPLSDRVSLIIGNTEGGVYEERLEAIRRLSRELSPEDVVALIRFLRRTPRQEVDLDLVDLNMLKDRVVMALMRQKRLPSMLGREIMGLYENAGSDDEWRGRCIAQMARHYARRWPPYADQDELTAQQRQIRQVLWDAVAQRKAYVSHSALTALCWLSQRYKDIDEQGVADEALKVAAEPDAPLDVRVSAMEICALLGVEEALPLARGWVRDTPGSASLRLAAVAVMAELGGWRESRLLRRVISETDGRLREASELALGRIEERRKR